LALIRDPADRSFIEALTTDPVLAVREQAARILNPPIPVTLSVIESANSEQDLKHSIPAIQQTAVDTIARQNLVELAPALVPLLDSPDSMLRRHVCEALGKLRAEPSTALADQLANDKDPLVQKAAADALLAIHSPALIDLLKNKQAHVRVEAARVLGLWGEPTIATNLFPLVTDRDPLVARTAANALGRLGYADSRSVLADALATSPPFVQERITWALGELRATTAVPAIIALLHRRDDSVETAAAEALGKLGNPQAIPALRQVLTELTVHNYATRQRCWESLRKLGDRESAARAIQFITEKIIPPPPGAPMPMYDVDDVRAEALRYLEFIGEPQLADEVQAKLPDAPSYTLRLVLAEVVTKLTGKPYRAILTTDSRRYFVESLDPILPTALGNTGIEPIR